ncbi:Gldg family protein [Nodularia spumigena CS-1038]|uniref:GldG family protein n=1 Tax=Nodularia spumigena TaxID=70799 RepID=UPI00232BD59F|nr:Gldg family protein [Nodularia spumigena]MDB9341493.1 Gldg family protein [Nodularia spumigena CS-589/07]MDB9357085.1 Gldg family protein [Nodularia spumigena CS-587/03]MDB9533508.1 Gldg family protein [Nodularia spumigena CS-1038]
MNIIKKKKLGKYLFWLGPFLVAAGLTSGLVSGNWGIIPLIFIITGTVISGVWIVLQSQQNRWWNSRSTQASTNALIAIVAVFVILGLVNFLATRYNLRQDLTEAQLYTLSPQSQNLVRRLPQSVKVWVFDTNRNPQDGELLENYRRQSSNFQFEYIDPQARPTLANKFGVQDYGEVYLESGDNRQLVQKLNVNERLSEVRLTNRLQQITTTTTTSVCFLQGHGEKPISGQGGISQAIQSLDDINYIASPLNLVENSQVPEDCDVVIVAGPKQELFDNEVKTLQNYLNRGGNALLMIDPNTDTNLDSLLQEWGISLDNRLVVDVSGTGVGLGPAVPIVTNYGQHPITAEFRNGISFYQLARPLEINTVPDIEAKALLQTQPYPQSWAESDLKSEKLEFDSQTDTPGSLTLGVALTRTIPATTQPTPAASPTPTPETQPTPEASPTPTPTIEDETNPISTTEDKSEERKIESRLVVIGDSDFATDGLFQQQLNGDVFLNSVTWLSQQDQQLLSIRPKEARNRRINLNLVQANLLTLSSLLLLPLMGLVTAAIMWWKRR